MNVKKLNKIHWSNYSNEKIQNAILIEVDKALKKSGFDPDLLFEMAPELYGTAAVSWIDESVCPCCIKKSGLIEKLK